MPGVRFAIENEIYGLGWAEAGVVAAILRSFGSGRDSPDLRRLGELGLRISEAAGPLADTIDAALSGGSAEPIEVEEIQTESVLAALEVARIRETDRQELASLRVALESLRDRSLAPLRSLPTGQAVLDLGSYDF